MRLSLKNNESLLLTYDKLSQGYSGIKERTIGRGRSRTHHLQSNMELLLMFSMDERNNRIFQGKSQSNVEFKEALESVRNTAISLPRVECKIDSSSTFYTRVVRYDPSMKHIL